MPSYSRDFDPPAPVVSGTIYCPVDHTRITTVLWEIDTGADISVVPQRVVDALKLIPRRVLVTESYDGTQSQWPAYMVDLGMEEQEISDVEVIALPRQNGILGRDVLNHFIVTLNGKDLTVEIALP